jgi:membrane protein implicated in regulation of membrane protease activity
MTLSIAGVLFALLSFIATFTFARVLGKWLKKRQAHKDEEAAARNQSRQVRRARERRKARR